LDQFIDPELGKVAPYGVYDLTANAGWVNVGIDHDTAEFAVESIRRWWREMGEAVYPNACRLLITADCGGSNGHRVRLWRRELQKLSDELRMTVQVCHFPPGTSKWNRIEHRMFCHITANWRGRPLSSRQVVVNLIGSTTTREGLRVKAGIDENAYAKGIKVTDEELATLAIERDAFHGEWNYRPGASGSACPAVIVQVIISRFLKVPKSPTVHAVSLPHHSRLPFLPLEKRRPGFAVVVEKQAAVF